MHASELVQIAAVTASHAPLLVEARVPFPKEAIERYWVACKCQQEDWSRALSGFLRDQQGRPRDEQPSWIVPLLEEVLTTDVFHRVWGTINCLVDNACDSTESSGVVRGVLEGQREFRDRILNALVYGHGLRVTESVAMHWYRIRCERWTDSLLSLLGSRPIRSEWAFQPWRVRRLAAAIREQEGASAPNLAGSTLLATLQLANVKSTVLSTSVQDWNRQIANCAIACFPPHVFDSTGRPVSVHQLRMWNSSSDNRARAIAGRTSANGTSSAEGTLPAADPSGNPPRRFDFR